MFYNNFQKDVKQNCGSKSKVFSSSSLRNSINTNEKGPLFLLTDIHIKSGKWYMLTL